MTISFDKYVENITYKHTTHRDDDDDYRWRRKKSNMLKGNEKYDCIYHTNHESRTHIQSRISFIVTKITILLYFFLSLCNTKESPSIFLPFTRV